jgi:Dyp-type peroxidase family
MVKDKDLDDKKTARQQLLKQRLADKRFQRGVEVPKAGEQEHLLILRLDLALEDSNINKMRNKVKDGLKTLCGLFERLDSGEKSFFELDGRGVLQPINITEKYKFSSTVGFGIGFFDRLGIPDSHRPRKLKGMPDHDGLGDVTPYSLSQTDLIIQLGSSSDFINRWVHENAFEPEEDGQEQDELPQDIVTAVNDWATITEVHSGFQRIDGRNLMGFNDGISNPNPGTGKRAQTEDPPGFDDIVWTTEEDEGQILKDGTYMVFQKISHDLDQWRELDVDEQEEWVGRDKVTGLLLGTPENDDEVFKANLKKQGQAGIDARKKLAKLIAGQSHPESKLYDEAQFKDAVPRWSHVRKANPRDEVFDDQAMPPRRIGQRIIFRRGYPFIQTGLNNRNISGLLFVSFQRDIEETFEFIKKNWFGSKNFPTPIPRRNGFTEHERTERHKQGRLTGIELVNIKNDMAKRELLGLKEQDAYDDALEAAGFDHTKNPPIPKIDPETGKPVITDTQNTGREGLAGPSELGNIPTGEFLAIVPFGGGYYFVPPIPKKSIKDIGQQFFE